MLDRVTGIESHLTERDLMGSKVVAILRNQPVLLPFVHLSLFRKPLLSNSNAPDPVSLPGTT